jgi:hypothetical protein
MHAIYSCAQLFKWGQILAYTFDEKRKVEVTSGDTLFLSANQV